jgi:hypothetical protein
MDRSNGTFHRLDNADEFYPGNIAFFALKFCSECGFVWVVIDFPKGMPQNLRDECPYCLGNKNLQKEKNEQKVAKK